MKKRVKIYALILLALCLSVPVVNAVDIVIGQGTYNLGNINTNLQHFTVKDVMSLGKVEAVSNCQITNVNLNSKSFDVILYTSSNTASFTIGGIYMPPQVYESTITINYNYQEPTPEPLGPYLDAILLSESTTGLTYQIKPMPDDGTYLFSRVNTGNPSAVDSTVIYSSEDAAINYIIGRGTSQTFYCNYKEGYWGLPQTMSITLSAPIYSEDVLINATIINNTLQNMPNPVKPSENNPISSGNFQPIGKNAIINSPFGNLVTNGGLIFSLPHMESPQLLRDNLLNGTGNLTAPLYDAVDSVTAAVLFVPSVISGALSSVVSPLLETVDLLKNVFDSLFEVINNSMDFIYYLLPTVYLLIPDAVWWCVIAVLCYFIFKWILIFVFGNDVINAYFEKGGKE